MKIRASRRSAVALNLAIGVFLAAVPLCGSATILPVGLAPAPAYQLRITGPAGFLLEREFLKHESIDLSSMRGKEAWPDGQYLYEIVPVMGLTIRDDASTAAVDDEFKAAVPESASGSFRIDARKFLLPGRSAAAKSDRDPGNALLDQVIPDDLIVQGSGCFGFDCVNNENFSFDTIRLKENNLRIKFEDTSTGAFPSTDWQLTANDSASGGANRFSIEDVTSVRVPFTITGGATTNSIFVDSTGRVGFRTGTPVLDLHVNTSDTPAMRLEQNSSGGFSAQTWDIGANEANFFVRDVTGGSRLPLRIRPGAPTSAIDIAASGNVGIGTASPAQKLELNNAGPVALDLNNTTGARWRVRSGAGNNLVLVAPDDATSVAELTLDVGGNLTIAGNFFAQGGTQLTVPDYVFKPGYALMPLEELDAFIRTHQHLPNIPSEAQVAADGKLNMTQLQLKLLEKVEELTLYTLQQDRQIKALEARLAEVASAER